MDQDHFSSPLKEVRWVTPARVTWALFLAVSVGCGASLAFFPPELVFMAVVALFGAMLLFYYPYLGIIAYLAFEYLRIPAMFPVLQPLQLGKVIVLATFAAWALQVLVTRKIAAKWDNLHGLMIAWTLLAFLSIAVARDRPTAIDAATDLAKWVGVYLMVVLLTDTPTKWKVCFWTLLLLNLKIGESQLLAYVRGIAVAGDTDRFITEGVGVGAGGFFETSTDLGAAMAVIAPLALGLFDTARTLIGRGIGAMAFLVFSVSVLRTGSRGAFVALFAIAAVYWLRSSKKIMVGVCVVVGLIVFFAVAPGAWEARFARAAQYESDPTASARIRLWKAGFQMFVDNPLTGVGIRNFPATYEVWTGRLYAPHSIWVQAGAELGIFGLAILCAIVFVGFRRNSETRALSKNEPIFGFNFQKLSYTMDMSFVAFLVSGSFVTILYYPYIFVTLAMIISLNQIARNATIVPQMAPLQEERGLPMRAG